ncbi:MAG: hypothetical protein DPW16_18460 [Chloroflexi bacterium]|nr:hypothetical protein [Chloroflexota bacterium]
MLAAVWFVLSGIFLSRSILITLGLLKGPVLRAFERYGDEEGDYNSLLYLLFWMGMFSVMSGLWLARLSRNVFFPMEFIGVVLLIGSSFAYRKPHIVERIFHYPVWYYELKERTSRSERRRIAYMWLHISRKGKLIYNSSDFAFNQWADLIIVSTIYIDSDSEEQAASP